MRTLFVSIATLLTWLVLCGTGKSENVTEGTPGSYDSNEQRLYDKLFHRYNKYVRPRKNSSEAVKVDFVLRFYAINVEEKEEIFKIMVSFEQYWYDDYLHWDPSQYGNLTSLVIPNSKIWKPLVMIGNGGGDNAEEMTISDKGIAYISAHGLVTWPFFGKVTATCLFDMRLFPYDQQICPLMTKTEQGDSSKVDIQSAQAIYDKSHFLENARWDVLNVTSFAGHWGTYPYAYPYGQFSFILKRRSEDYLWTFIGPILSLSGLTFLTFFIPIDSGERLSVCLTCFVSFSVFIVLITDGIPSSVNGYPVTASYLCLEMGICLSSMAMSVIVMNIDKKTTPVPTWLAKFCRSSLIRAFCISPKGRKKVQASDNKIHALDTINDSDDADPKVDVYSKDDEVDWHFVAKFADRVCLYVFIFLNLIGFFHLYDKLISQIS